MSSPILKKTHPKSYIRRFHVKSSFADKVFKEKGDYIVLQVMEISNSELIAELITKENYKFGGE